MRAIHFVWRITVFAALVQSAVAAPLFFTLPREKPWRFVDGAPTNATPGGAKFEGTARPGEFFVFQVGIVNTTKEPITGFRKYNWCQVFLTNNEASVAPAYLSSTIRIFNEVKQVPPEGIQVSENSMASAPYE